MGETWPNRKSIRCIFSQSIKKVSLFFCFRNEVSVRCPSNFNFPCGSIKQFVRYLRTSASCQTNGKRGYTCLYCILDLPRHVRFGRNRIKNTFLHHRMAGSALRSPPCICMMQFHPETFVTMRTYHALIVCGALEGALLHVFGEFREFRCIRCRGRFGKGLGPGIGKAVASDAHWHAKNPTSNH